MIIPLKDKLFIRMEHSDDQLRKGSIAVPETNTDREAEGIVEMSGPKCRKFSVGDRVLIPRRGTTARNRGDEIVMDDARYLVISEDDILGQVL